MQPLLSGQDIATHLRPYLRRWGDPRRPAWHIPKRRLLDYLLVYIASGTGTFELGGTAYEVEPGDLFWVPPDTLHDMRGHSPAMRCPFLHFDLLYDPARSHWNHADGSCLTKTPAWEASLHPPLYQPAIAKLAGRLRSHNNHEVGQLIIRLCHLASQGNPYAGLQASGLLLEIVALILYGQHCAEQRTAAANPLAMERAAALLRDQCGLTSVEDAAAQVHLSESHFRHLFKHQFGCSPRTYLRRARIARAKDLMETSSESLSQIAERCGFATVHSFSRAFRDIAGIPPSHYRRSISGDTLR